MARKSEPRSGRKGSVSENNSRFFDIPTKVDNNLNPIEGFMNCPLRSLHEAIDDLEHLVSDVKYHARHAENMCKPPYPDGLSLDRLAAIKLYTMEWKPQEKCLYFVLNQALRNRDRNQLKPWFAYLKLLLTSLFQLESVSGTVFRGVKLDLHREYPVGTTLIWWAFSSCTDTLGVLESDKFLGKKGARTIFIINCSTGKNISKQSYYSHESEILLIPATKFIVTSSISPASDFHMITLREVPSSSVLLEPFCGNIDIPINSQLDSILSAPIRNELDLTKKNLNDRDMVAVCKTLRSNTSWISLDLSLNKITLDGAIYISNALKTDRTLKNLNLSGNQLTDFGVTTIAHGLDCNRTLESISLSSNQITDKGVESFVDMLHQNQTVVYLDLSANEISDEGVRRFTDLLMRRNCLRSLFLNNNKVTDNSVQDVIRMLNVNSTLVTLYLHENHLSKDGISRIRSATLTRSDIVLSL